MKIGTKVNGVIVSFIVIKAKGNLPAGRGSTVGYIITTRKNDWFLQYAKSKLYKTDKSGLIIIPEDVYAKLDSTDIKSMFCSQDIESINIGQLSERANPTFNFPGYVWKNKNKDLTGTKNTDIIGEKGQADF